MAIHENLCKLDDKYADVLSQAEQLVSRHIASSAQTSSNQSEWSKIAPYIEQVKVLSEVYTQQEDTIEQLSRSLQSQEGRQMKLLDATIKRRVDQVMNQLTHKVESLEI